MKSSTSNLIQSDEKIPKEWYTNYLNRVPELNSLATKELLWNQLCLYIKDIEKDAIRRQIGEQIISETEELHNELKSLIEILYDYRAETQQHERQVEWARMSFKGDTIFKQVKLNIQSLTEMLKKPPSRPETPRPSSRQSSNSSDGSESSTFSAGLEMKEVEKHLNFVSVHEVLSSIREAMRFEKDILTEDIEYIRELIDEEFSFNKSLCDFKVPSLSEVKQVENKLQENLRIASITSHSEKKKELKPLSKTPLESTRPKTPTILSNNLKKSSSTVSRLRNAIRQIIPLHVMSYSPTQIQHTQVQEDEEEQSNGSESPQESESSHSYIATQVQDNDDTMYDEEDDQPENPEQYHEEDNLEQKNKEEEHNELEFDEEEKEPKKSSKKKKKKSEVKEKKRRQKKDDDDDYQDKDEESDKSANEEDENNEEVDTKKKRKRLQKGKEKRKKRKESNNDEASPSNEEESSLIHDEENEGSSRSKQNVDDDDEFNKFVLKEVKSRRSASSDKILENTAQPQATELIKRINAAYFDDVEAYHKRKPALNKLQLLPEVIESCKKIYLQSHLITEGILGALEKWIVPDKDLPHPSINIQTGVLTILNDLPVCSSYEGDEKFITRELLKSSKIPKTVKQIANNPSTTPSNRKLAKKIVERWSRLVYQLPSEYGEMYKKQPLSSSMKEDTQTSKPTPTPSFSKSSEPIQRKKPKSNSIRASIPKKESFDFKRLPPSKVTQKKEKEENEVHKRMLNVGTRKR